MIYIFLEFLMFASQKPFNYMISSARPDLFLFCKGKGEKDSRVSPAVGIELPSLLNTSGPPLTSPGPHGYRRISGA